MKLEVMKKIVKTFNKEYFKYLKDILTDSKLKQGIFIIFLSNKKLLNQNKINNSKLGAWK